MIYWPSQVALVGSYLDWVSAYNTDQIETVPLAESGWTLNVSNAVGSFPEVIPSPEAPTSPPADQPVETGLPCNKLMSNPAAVQVGTATVKITRTK